MTMKNKVSRAVYCLLATIAVALMSLTVRHRPVVYLVGDSTVAVGWGKYLGNHFDTTAVSIQNRAVSGTSTRTFITQAVHDKKMTQNGMWNGVIAQLQPHDVVIIQFGHNDDSPLADTSRSRGTIKGISDSTTVVFNRFLNKEEVVHSFGWYLAKMVKEAQAKGAMVIICSPIPKNKWLNGKVIRNNQDYGKWCAMVASNTGASFLDLNQLVADRYDVEGQAKVSSTYFTPDHVHTTPEGSALNAAMVATGIRALSKAELKKYLK
jgi:rhamnogalacturonan acetylesterase